MVKDEYKQIIDKYQGIHPSAAQRDEIMKQLQAKGFTFDELLEVNDYMEKVFNGPTREQIEKERREAEEQARKAAEAERLRKEEEERRRLETVRIAEEAKRKAEEAEAMREAAETARKKAEAEAAKLRLEIEARRKEEQMRKDQAALEQVRRYNEELQRRREEEERRAAERRKQELEERRKREEAQKRAEEEARRRKEAETRRKAEEASRRKAEEASRRKAEEEARRKKAEEEARIKEAERKRRQLEKIAKEEAKDSIDGYMGKLSVGLLAAGAIIAVATGFIFKSFAIGLLSLLILLPIIMFSLFGIEYRKRKEANLSTDDYWKIPNTTRFWLIVILYLCFVIGLAYYCFHVNFKKSIPENARIESLKDNYCTVKADNHVGLGLKEDGKPELISEIEYDSIGFFSKSDSGKDLFIVKQNKKYGLLDDEGDVVVDVQYIHVQVEEGQDTNGTAFKYIYAYKDEHSGEAYTLDVKPNGSFTFTVE